MTAAIKGWSAPVFLVLCLMLGGASGIAAGALANAVLQGIAVILILVALWSWRGLGYPRAAKALTAIFAVFALYVLLSLVPLPAQIWQQLPGRDPVTRGLEMLGMAHASLPASLAPHSTISSLLWLLPPTAMFLLVLRSSPGERKRLPPTLLGFAVLSVVLGAAQLVGGPNSPLRPYEITNPTLPVGFFASANHLATLILCALPFAGYLAARSVQRESSAKRRSGMATAIAVVIFLAIGISIIGSLAGYGLLLVVGLATLLIYRRAAFGPLTPRWLIAAGVLFFAFLGLALLGPLQEQALSGKLTDHPTSRKVMARTTLTAAADYLPVGSGLGSFPDVYRTYDDPGRIDTVYVNHAHNDYLEVALELGVPGLLIILLFMLWWIARSVDAWRSNTEGANLARAASVVILPVLLHSIVDYPIRTSAISAVFAMACALLVPSVAGPRRSTRRTEPGKKSNLRHLEAD